MSKADILKKLNDTFRLIFDDDNIRISESTSAYDIEDWDSLAHVRLIAAIEADFGVSFSMEDIIGFKSVGDIVIAVERCLK